MNQARQPSRVSNSNPASVLQKIAASQGNIIEQRGRETKIVEKRIVGRNPIEVEPAEPPSEQDHQTLPSIKLHVDSGTRVETVEQVLESCVESAEQVQQLARRLVQNENVLRDREADLDQRIKDWDRHVREQESEFDKKLNQLEQQASQVKCQQLHLMQLQTDIVKSHEATKQSIESLVVEAGTDQKTITTLQALKYELSGRFDYIARRWEHLSKLMQSNRDQDTASSTDDSVRWEGEWA